MPRARPTQASVANVIAAMKAAGHDAVTVSVSPDGGFTVSPAKDVDLPASAGLNGPRQWGERRDGPKDAA